MPLYEYNCGFCNHDFDEYQPITKFDPKVMPKCPKCNRKSAVHRVINRPPKLGITPSAIEEHPRWKDVPIPDVPINADGTLDVDQNYEGLL